MDYAGLDKSLKRGLISPVYIFYGEETYLRDGILGRFKDLVPQSVADFNLDLLDGREAEIESILGMASTLPFMAEKRMVIVKNAPYFKSKRKNPTGKAEIEDKEKKVAKDGERSNVDSSLLRYLENPLDSTCLIFCTDTVDKKRKTIKAVEKVGQLVEFSPLKGQHLNDWIARESRRRGKIIEPAAVPKLVTAIGNNLQQLSTEIEKLCCYAETEKITLADVDLMVSRTAELSVFDLVDAIGEKKYKEAIKLAREMVYLGEPVIKLLFMIARQFRLLLRTAEYSRKGVADGQIAGQLQVHPYVAQKCIKQARNFNIQELIRDLEGILAADEDIKTGKWEAMPALERLIITLCD